MKRYALLLLAVFLFLLGGCGADATAAVPESGGGLTDLAAYPETMTLTEGDHDTIQVVFTPSDTTDRDLIWATSNRSVAVVDESGKVTAMAPGSCTVTVASKSFSDVSCHVEVIVEGAAGGEAAAVPAPEAAVTGKTPAAEAASSVAYVGESDPSRVYPAYYLTEGEAAAMDADTLQFTINQIYAKNGYLFRKTEIQSYFERMPWYTGITNDTSRLKLSAMDQANLNLLVKHRGSGSSSGSGLGWLWTKAAVEQPLSANYVKSLSKADVQLLVNTIYAKNGYIFETAELQRLFDGQSWYHGTVRDAKQIAFSKQDQANLNLLLQYR